MKIKSIEQIVPKLHEGTRLKSTPSGYILSSGGVYAPMNLDAAAIVSKIDGSKTIEKICQELFEEKSNIDDFNILGTIVQRCIAKIWQQGAFLQVDDNLSMAYYSYYSNNCFYSPYFSSDVNLEPVYLSPIFDSKHFSNITEFKEIFGSFCLYVTLLNSNSEIKSQYCILKTQVKDLYFIYAIYGNTPTVDDLREVKQYLQNNPLDEENHIEKTEKNDSITFIVYTLSDLRVDTLPFTLIQKGVIQGEVNGRDLIINFLCI